jgi:pyruvate dehydrogenase E2 component (dihydrolipoamide acetyltransferase)
MESGRLAAWLKQDGEAVQAGEMLFSVEGDKAVQEVEALESGILRILPGGPGPEQDVPVGTLLAYICQPGETPPFEVITNETISPRARRAARELAVDWSTVKGTGITGRIRERDIRAAALERPGPSKAVAATPVARRAAAELGVDLAAISRPGEGERISRADVEAAAQKAVPADPGAGLQAVPMGRLRKLIAERMAASARTTAPVTLTTEVDATELFKMRRRWKNDPDLEGQALPSYTDMLVKLVAQALSEYPVMNARLEGEQLVYQEPIHIAMAVDTPAGLVAPVIRMVQTKGLKQIARESAALVEKALAGRLSLDEVSGSTFTVTNLGMYDIDSFTPLINLPECAILGVGRIVARVVVIDEETEATAVRRMMALSLTFDHRVVDGAPAARFLQRIRQLVEKPDYWLL